MMNNVFEFIKRQNKAFWFLSVAAILALVGAVLLIVSNSVPNQEMLQAIWVIIAAFVGFIALGFSVYGYDKFGDKLWLNAITYLGMVCVGFAFCFLLANRVPLVVNLATWDGLNTLGWTAFYTAVVAIVADLLAMIFLSIAMFKKLGNKQ